MNTLDLLEKVGLVEPAPKKTGLKIARDALAKSHPGSPQLAYLDKMIKKQHENEKRTEAEVFHGGGASIS